MMQPHPASHYPFSILRKSLKVNISVIQVMYIIPKHGIVNWLSNFNGIVTLIKGAAAKDYNDVLSGCRARAIPHIEDVSPKSFERGSVE